MASERGFRRSELRSIATYQKAIMFCILGYFGAGIAAMASPAILPVRLLIGLCAVGVIIAALVFTILLATQTFSTGVAVLLGILVLIPLIGLIVLLIINQRATAILRDYDIRVGFLGANMSDLDREYDRPRRRRRPRLEEEWES
jgi:hypothetical protein